MKTPYEDRELMLFERALLWGFRRFIEPLLIVLMKVAIAVIWYVMRVFDGN